MHKTIALLCTAAAMALGVFAASAMADVPNPMYMNWPTPTGLDYSCSTPSALGVDYQYGAWGAFVDGCTTTRATCPTNTRYCEAHELSHIADDNWYGHRVTLNTRLRLWHGFLNYARRDDSCDSINWCNAESGYAMAPGDAVTAQCNGVHVGYGSRAWVRCGVSLVFKY